MANITKQKRDQMLAFLEELKKEHSDDASIRALNEIENHINEKKFGLVFEEHTEAVDELLKDNIPVLSEDHSRRIQKDASFPWSFLIEGDNLQALYLLEKTHRNKTDCIYLDPPYNTGAKDWKYNNDYVDSNDTYRHSKWLSMMKARLELAKRLLKPDDSILVCTIDEKEVLHLGCLLEEIFPNARIQMVDSVINRKGVSHKGKKGDSERAEITQFSRVSEYLFFVMLGKASIMKGACNMLDAQITDVEEETVTENVQWLSMLRRGSASQRADKPKHFYPIFVNQERAEIIGVGEPLPLEQDRNTVAIPDGAVAVWPMRTNGSEGRWQLKRETFIKALEEGFAKLGSYNQKQDRWAINYLNEGIRDEIEKGTILVTGKDERGAWILKRVEKKLVEPKSVWNQTSHNASEYGTSLLNSILVEKRFDYPKSLYAVRDTLKLCVGEKPDAVVIDFFAGSGTTMHAVNLLNAEDGGRRKCIIATNNEVSANEEKALKEKGLKKGDKEWEDLGIARYVTWPRIECSINGINTIGQPLSGEYITSEKKIEMSEGFIANVKYFKCDWTPRKPEDYLLSNMLCLHIKEMIELQNAIEIDGEKNVLILNKDDIRKNILDPIMYEKAKNIWLNQNIILNAEEMKLLNKKGFKYIPREFFGQELKEAAE